LNILAKVLPLQLRRSGGFGVALSRDEFKVALLDYIRLQSAKVSFKDLVESGIIKVRIVKKKNL